MRWTLTWIFLCLLAVSSFGEAGEAELKILLSAPLTAATGSYVAPENATKLRALLKANPKLANQPIYQLKGQEVSTALVEALKLGNVDAVRALLEFKAKPNLGLGKWPITPLEAAMSDRLDPNVRLTQVRLVLASGGNARLGLHLWAACTTWTDRKTYYAAADAMMTAKATLATRDDEGATPLEVAVVSDNALAVEKLLGLGAKIDKETQDSAVGGGGTVVGNQILKLLKLPVPPLRPEPSKEDQPQPRPPKPKPAKPNPI